jgi:hypothetical protein
MDALPKNLLQKRPFHDEYAKRRAQLWLRIP